MDIKHLSGRVITENSETEVDILYEGENKPCYLRIALIKPWEIVKIDETFQNPLIASRFLASELLYGPACDFLHAHGVDPKSQLWNLNHSGYSAIRDPEPNQPWKVKIASQIAEADYSTGPKAP